MGTDSITSARLERQKSVIDAISSRVEERQRSGEIVELSLSLLREEERLYRRMLGQASLDVLDEHSCSARFT